MANIHQPKSEFMIWNVDPVLLSLGSLQIRWYGLLFATGFIIGFRIMQWIYQREARNLEDLDRLLWYLVIGTIVGARLGHVLFYDPAYYLSHPLEILMIWKGGLASHGGGLGVLLAIYLFQRQSKDSYLWHLDRIAIPTALAAFFIRTGNLFNSEIVGVPTDVAWAIVFERLDDMPRHPAMVYEALSYMGVFLLLLWIYRRFKHLGDGALLGGFLIGVFTARFIIEFVKERQAAFSAELMLSMGQLLSLPFILAGLILLVLAWRGRNKTADTGTV